jgi:hypothetical protein
MKLFVWRGYISILLVLILFLGFYDSSGQAISLIELQEKEILIKSQINILNDSIKVIDSLMKSVRPIDTETNLLDLGVKAKLSKGARILYTPNPLSKEVERLPEGSEVILLDYLKEIGYFKIYTGSSIGFTNRMWIEGGTAIDDFINFKNEEKIECERIENVYRIQKGDIIDEISRLENDLRRLEVDRKNLKREEIQKEIDAENIRLEKFYIRKYGLSTYNKLKSGHYWIGMTKEMATISLGKPNRINRSVGSWGVHEQWVYDSVYLYFENEKLTSYQD